jgi:hypothetical protein
MAIHGYPGGVISATAPSQSGIWTLMSVPGSFVVTEIFTVFIILLSKLILIIRNFKKE